MAVKTPETHTALVRRARKINRGLAETYPDAHCELDFKNPFQLLVATVLSAQTTDKRVNLTTPVLFAKYPTPEDLAAANPEDVEEILKPTGFFRAKTKSVMVSRWSSVNPKRARTGAAWARLSTWLAVTRLPAMASSSAATPRSWLV